MHCTSLDVQGRKRTTCTASIVVVPYQGNPNLLRRCTHCWTILGIAPDGWPFNGPQSISESIGTQC